MELTAKLLESKGACPNQVALFRERFGESVQVTEELCVAVDTEFNWDWAATNLLSARAQKAYSEATARAFARAALGEEV